MNKIIFGDCRESMRQLISESAKVQMCVTSPPYYGLRDYGVEGQLGLEETPNEYIANMVETFRLVRNLLRADGTLWLNIGDTWAANRTYQVPSTKGGPKHSTSQAAGGRGSKVPEGLKSKDLIGIPWMLAFALRADGWYLRQDIIWNKPNAMPESIRDRCGKSHEYIFLLAKSEKYYFDMDAIKETAANAGKTISLGDKSFSKRQADGAGVAPSGNGLAESYLVPEKRNKRSVWTVTTKPYKGAHCANFPPDLIAPCILAGSRVSDVVFDPFMGSGTTAQVALQHGRQYLGCELNQEYKILQDERIAGVCSQTEQKCEFD